MSNLLNWPHWVIDLVEENEHDYRISAHLLNLPTACTLCGTVGDLRPYGVREQRFMDLPIHAKRVGILVGRRRFKCHACGRIAIEPLADMDEDHRMSKRLLRFVQSESLRITFSEVARQCGLDEKTVRDIFKTHTAQLAKTHTFVTPAVPMPPPTVQEEIALLLRGQAAWLTASEIAAKLSADLAVVRTELSAMFATGLIARRAVRGKTTREKYEYAVQPVQPVQPSVSRSA